MNKLIIYLLFYFSYLYSENCFEEWIKFNEKKIENNLLRINGVFKNKENKFDIYIEKNKRFKIEYLDKIIISNKDSIINYSQSTNQLFIEYPDTTLNNLIFSLLDDKQLSVLINEKTNTKFTVSNQDYGKIEINMNDSCNTIKSLTVNSNNSIVSLFNISFIGLKKINSDSLFNNNLDENKIFKYDFRK